MPGDASAAKQELMTRLKHLLLAVDGCLVTRHQKLIRVPTNLDRERTGFDDDKVPEEVSGQVSQH